MAPSDKAVKSGSSTARSSAFFSLGTLVSRVSGVAREAVVGAVFGAGTVMDAFVVAYRIPNLLRELVAEGALGSSFTQVYTKTAEQNEQEAGGVLRDTLKLTVLLGATISLLGIILAPWLVDLMSRRTLAEDSDQFTAIAVRQTQILFPTIAIFALTAIISGALHKKGRFFLSAVSPAMFNLSNIFGALVISPLLLALLSPDFAQWLGDVAVTGLSIGVLLGAMLQLLMAMSGIRKELSGRNAKNCKKHSNKDGNAAHNHWPRQPQNLIPWTPATKRIFQLMGPMVIAASAGQINVIVNTNFATSLQPGAVTWLNFAFRFLQLPVGVFGVAISSAVLPALTRAMSRSKTRSGKRVDSDVSAEITNSLELVAWFMIPSFALFQIASTEIITFFYQAGKFTAADTSATAIALSAYSFSLLGYGFLKVLNSYYYAAERTRYAMWVGIASIAVNFIGNYFLVSKFGHKGLALTASVTLTGNAILLLVGLHQDGVTFNYKRLVQSSLLLALATTAALTIAPILVNQIPTLSASAKVAAFAALSIKGLLIAIVFLVCAMLRLKSGPTGFLKKVRDRP